MQFLRRAAGAVFLRGSPNEAYPQGDVTKPSVPSALIRTVES
jgi:hypothetical protein